jgi:hypothetical protein
MNVKGSFKRTAAAEPSQLGMDTPSLAPCDPVITAKLDILLQAGALLLSAEL